VKDFTFHNSYFLFIAIGLMLMSACSLSKNLATEVKVYMGAEIVIHDEEKAKSIGGFKSILNSIPQNGTDNGIANLKIGLYNIFKNTPDKGFKHWVKYRLGSQPIIYRDDILDITKAKLEYYLKGKGFFSNKLRCDAITTSDITKLQCDVTIGERYRIDSLIFPTDTVYLTLDLDEKAKRKILKENAYYDRDRLDFERLRITTLAGNKGYADFRSSNVHFYLDTAKVGEVLDIYTSIVSPSDSTQHLRYILDSILVYPNYDKRQTDQNPAIKTSLDSNITIVETQPYLNHSLFDRLILEDPERYYNRSLQLRTNKRLQNLGLFQFVNIINEPSTDGEKNHITQKIFLNPVDIQSVSGELELNNRSGNTFGVGAAVSYLHKNLFGKAENFSFSVGGQVETQFGDGVSFINSADFNTKAELTIPRFVTPFITIRENKNYLPRTVVKAEYTFQRRTEFYSIQSLTAKFGYRWRHSASQLHELYPINVNEIEVTNETQEFLDLISLDTRLQRSFTDVLIGGLQYFYTYTSPTNSSSKNSHYFKASLETSGNLISVLLGSDMLDPKEIAGLDYGQFTKVTFDLRKYLGFSNSDLATRIIMGVGRAYGNSQELPYIKQYFVGGSNSLRAFRIRGLGPGVYYVDTDGLTAVQSQFLDQTGDMQLEMNVEYRFPVFKYFKSALFVDAGNIWLLNSPTSSSGNFDFERFYKEVAIGAGLGLRLDFDFFLIRLDTAFPLRGPTEDGFDWHFSDMDLLSRSWRQDNLRYNLGIGYPF